MVRIALAFRNAVMAAVSRNTGRTFKSRDTQIDRINRGLPRGGVRPHHGIEEEQDHEESQERQALIDSRLLISF